MASFEKPAKGHMGSTIKFSSDEDRNLFLGDLNSKSQIKEIFGSWKFEGIFDTTFFKFKEIIIEELLRKKFISENLFNKHGGILEKLHLCLKDDLKNLDESEQNKISVSFYETSSKLKELYYQFIRNEISTYSINEYQALINWTEQGWGEGELSIDLDLDVNSPAGFDPVGLDDDEEIVVDVYIEMFKPQIMLVE